MSPDAQVDWADNRIHQLEAEVKRLQELLAAPNEVRFEMTKGRAEFEVAHWAVRHLAASFWKSLGDAPNFMTVTLTHPDCSEAIEVTLRRVNGKTPAQLLAELRADLAKKDDTIRQLAERVAVQSEVLSRKAEKASE